MTNAETLKAAGFTKVRAEEECGEALTDSGPRLNGLACKKGGIWTKPGEPARCTQHAVLAL